MIDDALLDATTIRLYLAEVAAALPPHGSRQTILVVGGALLAWHGLRDATRDVDSIRRLGADVQEAARTVAERRGLAPAWLNDNAALFFPQTLHEADCDVLMDTPRLRVLGAPLEQVFLMKVHAYRDRDYDDLVAIWPRLRLTPDEAAAQYRRAFPAAPDDPYLADWIQQIADTAART